jgi:hypothetical protein
MASYEEERKFVQRMLDLASLVPDRIADPMTECGGETGLDVLCVVDGRKIGIQVTEYVADCGLPKPPDKSSRGEERKLAKQNPGGYGFSVSGEYIPALAESIKIKLLKTFSGVDEGWLLVAAQNPNYGSTSSTFVAADHLGIERMNAVLHPLLVGKHYAKAFLLLASEGVLFEWNPEARWHLCADARTPLDPQRVEALRRELFD